MELPAIGAVTAVLGAVVSFTVNVTVLDVVVFPAASYALLNTEWEPEVKETEVAYGEVVETAERTPSV